MADRLERTGTTSSFVEVIDRVLDKGIVIDVAAQVSVAGLHLIDVDARVVVASIETYLKLAQTFSGARRDDVPAWLAEHLEPGEPAPPVLWSA